MNALQRTFSDAALHEAWQKYRSKLSRATAVGVDGSSRDDFSANAKNEIAEIVALIRGGKYVFRPLKPYAIPKSGGKTRLINVPTIRDRFVQRILLDFLVSEYGAKWKIPNSFTSMGIDGEGVQSILNQAAKTILYTDYIIKADLSKYFDTIDRAELKSMIKKKVRQRSLHQLLFAVVDCETAARNPHERALLTANGIQLGRGIRQGMPLSPVLAYLFLADVDRQMTGRFFRYVDDLLFIGSTKSEAVEQFSKYKAQVESRGLKIHPLADKKEGKTHLIGPSESFEFLGLTVSREPG